MRQQHGINTGVGNALLGEGNERRRTEIDGKPRTRCIDQYTSLKTPPTPKCVSGSDESHPDGHVSRLLFSAHVRHSASHCVILDGQHLLAVACWQAHWITSLAWKRRSGEMVIPSACAVLRLMTSSYCIGCSTGRFAGGVPCRILSTRAATRRQRSDILGP